MRLRAAGLALACAFATAIGVRAETHDRLDLALPTDNHALLEGGGAAFYQVIERDFGGVKTKPWQGGRYGFVRNPLRTAEGLTYTRFHEGIDIRPLHRDAAGEPLDEVRAIAAGTVVYVNRSPALSNYGNYVVVEHRWDGCRYYSLYGHLGSVTAAIGEPVDRGTALGILGYTGEGLNRERAHLHLELNLMLSRAFASWHTRFFPTDRNPHGIYNGIYNGINLSGIDIARLYLALRKRPMLTIPEFLAAEKVFYRVEVPASKNFYLAEAYPWLLGGQRTAEAAGAFEISFNAAGVPVKISSRSLTIAEPQLISVAPRPIDYTYLTRGQIGGSGAQPVLTESGKRQMQLLTWPE